jgi:hypothetical protein
MIKFAENLPVNHAALYAGDDSFYHASTHEQGDPAVQLMSLSERASSRADRTITALRHHAVSDGDLDPGGVVDGARSMSEAGTAYAVVDLLSLVIPAFWRSYRHHFDSSGLLVGSASLILDRLARNLLADIELATKVDAQADAQATVTCSEMVYACYDRASPGCVQLTAPLSRIREIGQETVPSARGLPGDGRAAPTTRLTLTFDPPPPEPASNRGEEEDQPVLRDTALPGAGSARVFHVARSDIHTLLRRAYSAITNQAVRNVSAGKYANSLEPGTVLSDAVTPGDLWSSPSLAAHAVYHLPPTAADRVG